MAAPVPAQAANPVVVMVTNHGSVEIELFEDKAPITVKNFLTYVADKHYDGLIFHRVIKGFMIQGGGFEPGMKQKKTNDPIKNESTNGLTNDKGTLAMARTPVADSATSQFFINTVDNKFLNRSESRDGVGYCVFGKVIKGMDVVEKIEGVKTANADGHQNVPVEEVTIKTIRVK